MENTEDAINSHEATLHQAEDYSKPDISTPGDGIDRAIIGNQTCRTCIKTRPGKPFTRKKTVKTDTITISIKKLRLHFKHKCLQKYTKEIEKWEREFVVKNGFAPTFEHFQSEVAIMTAYKERNLSRELLKHWKITVHEH